MISTDLFGIELNAHVLIQLTVKASFLLVLILLGRCILRRTAASIRHLVLSVGIAFVCLMPLLDHVLPAWSIPIPESVHKTYNTNDGRDALALPALEAPGKIPSKDMIRRLTVFAVPKESRPLGWIAVLFVAGGLLAVGRVLLGIVVSHRRISSGVTLGGPAGDRVVRLTEEAQSKIRLPGPVPVRFTTQAQVPQVCGVIKPAIILPTEATDWSDRKLVSVLEHEMAHIRRRDHLLWPLLNIAAVWQWFNPLVWYALSQMRLEMEKACDDYVLSLGNSDTSYAEHLLELWVYLRLSLRPIPTPLTQVRRNSVVERVTYILNDRINRQATSVGRRLATLALVMGLALPIILIQGSTTSSPQLYGVSEKQKQGIIAALSEFPESTGADVAPGLPEADISMGHIVSIKRDGNEFVANQVFEINTGRMTIHLPEESADNNTVMRRDIVLGDQPRETPYRLVGSFERQIRLREENGRFRITDAGTEPKSMHTVITLP